ALSDQPGLRSLDVGRRVVRCADSAPASETLPESADLEANENLGFRATTSGFAAATRANVRVQGGAQMKKQKQAKKAGSPRKAPKTPVAALPPKTPRARE